MNTTLRNMSECGFGTCAGDPDCRDRHCPEHPCKTSMLGLPVIDPKFLDEQIGMVDLPIEMIEPIPSIKLWAEYLKTGALVVALFVVLGAVLLASVK